MRKSSPKEPNLRHMRQCPSVPRSFVNEAGSVWGPRIPSLWALEAARELLAGNCRAKPMNPNTRFQISGPSCGFFNSKVAPPGCIRSLDVLSCFICSPSPTPRKASCRLLPGCAPLEMRGVQVDLNASWLTSAAGPDDFIALDPLGGAALPSPSVLSQAPP